MTLRRALLPSLGLIAVALAGCGGPPKVDEAIPEGDPPSYAEIVEANNARVALLDRLWSRTVVRVDYVDRDGRDRSEQVEGHLQFVAPRRFLMTFTKLGELYFVIGSNEELYWWIQLGDEKQATVGRYDAADDRPDARVDLPVHPLDLIELLAIRPLPADATPETAWSPGVLVRVDLPARWGTRRLLIDPATLEPARVELRDPTGELAAASDLTRYMDVIVERDEAGPTPRVPQRFWVEAPESGVSIKVDLYEPETAEGRPRARSFDLDWLLDSYRVDDVRWIGDEVAGADPG